MRPRAGRRTPGRGFTILEVLITLAVTTIGLIGLLSLHLSVARGNDAANRSAEASNIANRTIEELRAYRPSDMLVALGASTVPIDTTALGTIAGRNNVTYARRVQVSALTAGTWKIRVEVSWTDDSASATASENGVANVYAHKLAAEIIRTTSEVL